MNKKMTSVIIIALALVLALSLAKDMIAKVGVERAVEMVTGLRLRVSSFNLGLVNTSVRIKGLKLYNPRGFEEKVMIDMPEAYVNYDLMAVFKGKIHVEDMFIDLKEFVVVKNADGTLNLDSLKMVREEKASSGPERKGKAPAIQIDKLRLKIGKAIYIDHTVKGEPSVREFNVNIDEQYSNISDPTALASLIVAKALMSTSIGSLAGFNVNVLTMPISGTLSTAEKITAGTVGSVGKVLSNTLGNPQGAALDAQETVSNTTQNVTNSIKSLFGSGEKKE